MRDKGFTIKIPRTPASSTASLAAASLTVSSFSHPPYINPIEYETLVKKEQKVIRNWHHVMMLSKRKANKGLSPWETKVQVH